MTGPAVLIDRMTATLRLDDHVADATHERSRFDRAVDRVRRGGLADAFSRVDLGVGHWCIRRLDVPLVLARGVEGARLGDGWADDLAAAVVSTIHTGAADVVHYRNDAHLMLDVLVSVTRDDRRRAWAWAQVIPALDVASDEPRRTALTVLAWRPHLAVPTLVATLARCDLASLARLLGPDGWAEVAALALPDVVRTTSPVARLDDPLWSDDRPWPDEDSTDVPPVDLNARHTDAIVGSSTIAQRLFETDLDLDVTALGSIAALVVAEAQPSALTSGDYGSVAVGVKARLLEHRRPGHRSDPARSPAADADPAPGRPTPSGGVPPATPDVDVRPAPTDVDATHRTAETAPGSPAPVHRRAEAPTPSTTTDADVEAASADDAARPTRAAGLLFLLNTAADAGLPSAALDEPALADRPLGWVLVRVAGRMAGISARDPACEALAGLTEDRADLLAELPPATEAAERALDHLACRWADATTGRIARAAGTDPAPPVEEVDQVPSQLEPVVRRSGRITSSPGWIDVELELADIDVDLRRAGLDLDPGWIPWLGTVVRFGYG